MDYPIGIMWDALDQQEWQRTTDRQIQVAEEIDWEEQYVCEELAREEWQRDNPDSWSNLTLEQHDEFNGEQWVEYVNDLEYHFMDRSLNKSIGYKEIAAAWAINSCSVGPPTTIEKYQEITRRYEEIIFQAVIDMELNAELSRRNYQNEMKIVPITRVALEGISIDMDQIRYRNGVENILLVILVARDDFRAWLKSTKQWPLADGCLLSMWIENEHTDTEAQADESPSVQNKEEKKRTRKTNLTRAVDAAIKTFGRKPSFDELWQFFQNEKDETTFIHDYTDTNITWMDTKGRFHDTLKTTLANHLAGKKS